MKRVTHKTAYKIYSEVHYYFVTKKVLDERGSNPSPLDAYTDAQLVKVVKGIEAGTQQNSEYLKRTGIFPFLSTETVLQEYCLEPHSFYTWLKEETRNRKLNKLLFC